MSAPTISSSGVVGLGRAADRARFGGKAANLARAVNAGLPVPPGFAIDVTTAAAVAAAEAEACAACLEALLELDGARVAVRSSALAEDGEGASFAGQHHTQLNVVGPEEVIEAIASVQASGRDSAAYRARMGLTGEGAAVAVVVQEMVDAEIAGVLFTRHPISGADERVVEATWGLGEAVVQGLVIPDTCRLSRGGELLAYHGGQKDVELVWTQAGMVERPVAPERVEARCLDERLCRQLGGLADACEAAFGPGGHDLEWAMAGGQLYLLQRRAITTG